MASASGLPVTVKPSITAVIDDDILSMFGDLSDFSISEVGTPTVTPKTSKLSDYSDSGFYTDQLSAMSFAMEKSPKSKARGFHRFISKFFSSRKREQ